MSPSRSWKDLTLVLVLAILSCTEAPAGPDAEALDIPEGIDADAALLSSSAIEVRELETLPGDQFISFGINDRGDVVGRYRTPSGEYHPFLWTSEDGMIDLGTLGGDCSTGCEARAINNEGVVVGNSPVPFIWKDGSMSAFSEISGVADVNDLNNVTQVVGDAFPHRDESAFIWNEDTGRTDLPMLSALGVSDNEIVVGEREVASGSGTAIRPFIWTAMDGARPLDVGTHGGTIRPLSVNVDGEVSGIRFLPSSSTRHGWVHTTEGGFQDLHTMGGFSGSFSNASEINDRGVATLVVNFRDSYVWSEESGFIELPPASATSNVRAINDYGMATGSQDGEPVIWFTRSPEDRAALVSSDLETLVDEGVLTRQHARPLFRSLEQAERQLDRDNIRAGNRFLQVTIDHRQRYIGLGLLDETSALPLMSALESLIEFG